MASTPKLLLALLAGFVSLFSGCCGVQCVSPCGRGITASCGSSCTTGCDTGACGSTSCEPACGCTGLLHGEIARRVKTAVIGGCSAGCGEVYCDEHINEPPTCDPCGCNGEFTGNSCGPCRPLWQRIKMLMGTPYVGNCGCDSCDHGCGHDAYATQHNGSGYCSSCRDGVAGGPQHHNVHTIHESTNGTPTMAKPLPEENAKPSEPTSKLEPTPDSLSRAPLRRSPISNGRHVSMK
jgi:hypothetical protein